MPYIAMHETIDHIDYVNGIGNVSNMFAYVMAAHSVLWSRSMALSSSMCIGIEVTASN